MNQDNTVIQFFSGGKAVYGLRNSLKTYSGTGMNRNGVGGVKVEAHVCSDLN